MRRNSSSSKLIIISLLILLQTLIFSPHLCYCFPFSTNNRFIVDESTGLRMILRCASWPNHMDLMLAEGLHKQPISNIVSQISKMGLNCIRLTWPTYMFTRYYYNQTIQQRLGDLGLGQVIGKGIMENNPNVLNMTHPQAFAYVVDQLGGHNIMVVSDNHISEPKWCCGSDDGNTFFGDREFNPDEWIKGHTLAAQLLKGKSNVVGISLRNELRGPNENLDVWYSNVKRGALSIHQANPDMVVIISGLNYAADLSFLSNNPLNISLQNKIVYEAHNYPYWSNNWDKKPTNSLCESFKRDLNEKFEFLTIGPNPFPVFISEFGMDLIGRSDPDERWLTCMLTFLAMRNLDWSWWGLQGSYYIRDGKVDAEEAYGLLNFQWTQPSYQEFPLRFQLVLKKLQDPGSIGPSSYIMYHPQSGQCVKADAYNQVELSDCDDKASGWSEDIEKNKIRLNGDHCLKSFGNEGDPAVVSTDCTTQLTTWNHLSQSGLHLAVVVGTQDNVNNYLCLEKDANSSLLVTNKCICVGDNDDGCTDNPQSQWFQFVLISV